MGNEGIYDGALGFRVLSCLERVARGRARGVGNSLKCIVVCL